jgi:hypothetical protein
MSGEIRPLPALYRNGSTILERPWHIHDSLLLKLTPGRNESVSTGKIPALSSPDLLFGKVNVTLEEPNMLLLDMAEYSMNGGEFYSEDELLRIDNSARTLLDIPLRRKEVVQPYLIAEEEAADRLTLRFRINSDVEISGAKLALEDAEHSIISLNSQPVDSTTDGWYVDRCIRTVPLPKLNKGENILSFTIDTDENFKERDHFTLRFHTINTPSINNDAVAHIAIRHKKHLIHYNYSNVKEGWNTIKVQTDSIQDLSAVYGYVAMPPRYDKHIMYIDSIELIRIHHTPDMETESFLAIDPTQEKDNGKDKNDVEIIIRDKKTKKKKDNPLKKQRPLRLELE